MTRVSVAAVQPVFVEAGCSRCVVLLLLMFRPDELLVVTLVEVRDDVSERSVADHVLAVVALE